MEFLSFYVFSSSPYSTGSCYVFFPHTHLILIIKYWWAVIFWWDGWILFPSCLLIIQLILASMLTDSWKDIFDKYHSCDLPTNIKIYHRNGCGPTPRSCHNLLSNSAHTSQLHDLNINIDGFWESIALLRSWNSTKYRSLSKLSYILADTVYMNCVMEAMDYCMDVRNLKTSMI